MTNESLEQRDFLLSAATLLENHNCPLESATVQGLRNLANKLAALESTQAQESELQTYREAHHRIDEIVMGAGVFEVLSEGGYKEAIENTVAAVSALSARTVPAEGERLAWEARRYPNGLKRYLTQKQYDAQTAATRAHYKPVCDACASRSPSYEGLLIIAQSVCGALARAGLTDCDDPGEAIDVIRERYEAKLAAATTAPVAGDAVELAAWREAFAHAVEVRRKNKHDLFVLNNLKRDVDAAIDTARPAKAEGDVQDAARYRWLRDRNGVQDDGVPVEIFIDEEAHSPGFLDAQVDAAMDTARTVSRGDETKPTAPRTQEEDLRMRREFYASMNMDFSGIDKDELAKSLLEKAPSVSRGESNG